MKQKVKKKIFFGGAKNYSPIIFKYLSDVFELKQTEHINDADIIYWIYGPGPKLIDKPGFWLFQRSRIIMHWIGTDVLKINNKIKSPTLRTRLHHKLWRYIYNNKVKTGRLLSIAGSEWLADELEEIKISSIFLPLTSLDLKSNESNNNFENRKYDAISYIPKNRFDFYGGEIVIELAKRLPNLTFLIVHPDLEKIDSIPQNNTPNLEIIPRVSFSEMQSILDKGKCFLRFTEHDGLSLSVLEAMSKKMHVFWTYNFPYTIEIDRNNIDDIIFKLEDTLKNGQPNTEGNSFIFNNYTTDVVKDKYSKILSDFVLQ